jgi:uncharacterized protein YecA (UPF0149 family)
MRAVFTPAKKKRISGQLVKGNGRPIKAIKVGRNELCPCGSGKKAKHCHGNKTAYLNQKIKES